MLLTRLSLPLLLMAATPLMAQKTNDMIREVQRDLASLQQDVKTLNSKFDEKIAVISTLLQQALTEAGAASKGVAVLDRQMKDSLKEMQTLVAAPVAAVNGNLERMGSDYTAVNENVKDLSARMSKLQSQLNNIESLLQAMQRPIAPPPAPEGQPQAAAVPPGVTADKVYTQAMRDKEGGNFELALSEFQDFLRFFPNEDRAPNSQYYIGEVYYYKKDFDSAIQAFDVVLEKYPENNKTPDAMYLKGRALLQTDRKAAANKVLTDLIGKYPNTDVARKARDLKKTLAGAPPAAKKRR